MPEKPTVLFVCVHNAGRSQMAAGFLRELGGDRVEVLSAGSEPKDQINPVAVQAMAEQGIDIASNVPKVLTTEAVRPIRDEIRDRVEALLAELLPQGAG